MSEALYNLLTNAWEANGDAGHGDRPIRLSSSRERLYVVLEVRDEGCGMTKAEQKKIFEPFYSSKNSNTSWGMGLYHVRTIECGRMWAVCGWRASRGKHPSCFCPNMCRTGDEMMKILIADDFELLREDLCDTLGAQADMEVVGAAQSGAQVEEMAARLDFDVLLIDIEMENTTAIRAAENILAEKPDTIVIFLDRARDGEHDSHVHGRGRWITSPVWAARRRSRQHIRKGAYEGEPMLDARVQHMVLKEYSRLRRSEKSLLFFINNVSQLTWWSGAPCAPSA